MPGLRSARGRVILAGVVLVVVLAGTATVAEAQPIELAADIAGADRAAGTALWLIIGLSALAFVVTAGAAALAVAVGHPLAALRTSARAITSGDLKARAKAAGPAEVAFLVRGVNEMTDAPPASTEEYAAITSLISDLILRADKDGRLTFLNDAACEFFGGTRERLLGLEFTHYVHPEDTESTVQAVHEAAARKGLSRGFVNRVITPLGTRVVQWDGYPLFDEDGQYAGFQVTGRDITEQKRAVQALRESEERYRQLVELSPYAIAVHSEGTILFVNAAVVGLLGASSPNELIGKPMWDFIHPDDREAARARVQRGQQERDRVDWVEQKIVRVDGQVIDTESAAFSVVYQGKPARQIIVTDISERKRAEEALRESKELFEKTFLSQRDAIFLLDAKNPPTITDCNPMAVETFGYSRQEMLGRTTALLHVDEATLEEFRGYTYSAVEEHGFLHLLDFHMRRKDGTVFPTEHSVVPLQDGQGKRIGWVSVVRDISERKRAEQALRESEEQYRALFEQAPDSVLLIDAETGALVEFNDRAHQTLGYTREEFEKLRIPDLEVVESPEEVAKHMEKIIKEGVDVFETKHRTKSGDVLDIEIRTRAVSVRGKGFIQTVFHDVTERKRAEEALQQEKDRAQKYLDVAEVILVAINREGEVALINQKGCGVLGYKQEDIVGKDWFDTFLPGRIREQVRGVFRTLMAGEIEPVEHHENLVLTRSGEQRLIAWRNTVLTDEAGNILGTLSSGEDITERKRAEEALRESEEKYRRLVQDSIVGIVIVEGLEIRFVNRAGLKMLGRDREEEMVGRPFTDFVSPEYREMMAERGLAREKGEDVVDRYEFKALRKDGSEFPAELSVSRITHGGKAARQAIVRDITDRKRAEEALQKARDELESRVERRMQQVSDHGLTFRELTVLHLVAAGESDKEIARVLGISPLTAHKHIANILAKMGATCRTEAGVRALREGLLD